MKQAVNLTALFMGLGTIWYIYLVLTNRVRPVAASWIILAATMTLGLVSYWLSAKHSLAGGIGNITGAASTDSIIFAVLWMRRKEKLIFSPIQRQCLQMAGVILVVWGILKFLVGGSTAATIANVLTQIVMVVGYVPLVERLKATHKDTESLFTWSMICLASGISMLPAVVNHDYLGVLYGLRAVLTSGIAVYLVYSIRYVWPKTQIFTGAST
ncbi:hypothetical protein KW785_01600 [Candidatus Parcubacteria bacterium]|nr:hypothetical protein [Candidatus Parcubacteria bacterium]